MSIDDEISPELLAELRNALRAQINGTSLRATARLVGMSPTGLQAFVFEPVEPYRKTVRKLLRWAAEHRAVQVEEVRRTGLNLILASYPGAKRPEVEARLRAVIEEADAPAPTA